jgi:hypothetical protein
MYENKTIMYVVFIMIAYVLWLFDYIKNKRNGK